MLGVMPMSSRCCVCIVLCGCLVAVLCAGCGSSGGSLPFDPANPPTGYAAALPDQFASTQGVSGWYYYSATPAATDFQALDWGAAEAGTPYAITAGWQRAATPDLLIGKGKLHPGTGMDAVLCWQATKDGKFTVDFTLTSLLSDSQGDGISASIWHNSTQASGTSLIPNLTGQSPTVSVTRTVVKNDKLYLRVSPLQSATADWFGYKAKITEL